MSRPRIVFGLALMTGTLMGFMISQMAAAQSPGLTEESYCNLHGRILSLLEIEWDERVKAAEALAQSPMEDLLRTLGEISLRHGSARGTAYSEANTTEAAFGKFGSDSKDSIDQYLNDHPDKRQDIDAVKSRVDALIQTFETHMRARQGQ